MKRTIVFVLALLSTALASVAQTPPPYLDESLPLEDRVSDAISRMTVEEKVAIIHAQSKFSSPGVPRLGIPGLWTTDGPHGIRPEVFWDEWDQAGWTNDSCTAFPALTCLAATWDPALALAYGRAIGEEARYRGKDVLLGPGVNICRTPLGGRNFEYMGEDPRLAATMVVPYVRGVQENGVAACVKHYALNNQEVNRHTTNVTIDERTLREIYLPAFRAAAIEGVAWSFMGSYNLIDGEHGCHNKRMICDILKGEWGFDGALISDWGGTHDTREAIANGLDLEFGSWTNGLTNGTSNAYDNYYMARPYLNLVKSGEVGTKELDDKARRVLRLIFRTSFCRQRPFGSMGSEAHSLVARTVGHDGIVLLRNERRTLPIRGAAKILVVGENAIKKMSVGGGSSSLKARYEISPLDGLRQRFGGEAAVEFVRGYVGDTSTVYNGVWSGQNLRDDRTPAQLIAEAVEAARRADYVIFVGGLNKSAHQDCEDADRTGLELPYGQDAVIEALASASKCLVVVNISGNAVAMPWADKADAIVQDWYLGSEAGHALADVLSGDACPSGKLPMTFPRRLADVGAHSAGEYPGTPRADGSGIVDERYDEGIFVGYRWAEAKGIRPLFPFGHGLSYTTFAYSGIRADRKTMTASDTLHVSVRLTNTGAEDGAEVAQLYVGDLRSSLPRPKKELKAFRKERLAKGESRDVTFAITAQDLSYFDDTKHEWVAEPGDFDIAIGSSSADIRAKVRITLK